MANEVLVRSLLMAISKTPEASYNTIPLLTAGFFSALMEAKVPDIPGRELLTDVGKIGFGNEFGTVSRMGYWNHANMTIAEELNVEVAGRLGLRAVGGAVTDTNITPTFSYSHKAGNLVAPTNLQLPSTSLAWTLNGLDMALGGGVVDQFQITQQGGAPPKFSANIITSGLWKRFADAYFTPALTLPAGTAFNYFIGAASTISYNDGSTRTLSSNGKFRGLTMTLLNQLRQNDRRAGDPVQVTGDVTKGFYVNHLLHSNRTATAQLVVQMDNGTIEWDDFRLGTILTNVTFTAVGAPIPSSTDPYKVIMIAPKCIVTGLKLTDNNEEAVYTIDLEVQKDSVTGGLFTYEVDDGQTTLA